MFADRTDARERAASLAAVAAIHLALGYALLSGLAVDLPRRVAESLETFSVLPPPPVARPPEPRPKAPTHRAPRKEGAASPANLRARATPVVAPPPIVPPPPPPPVVTAVKAGEGTADHAGAAPVPGPGTGSGGIGEGTGSGRYGDGPGGGGRGGGRRLEWISGRIKDSDYPRGAPDDEVARTVGFIFTVGIKGRVTSCTVTRSSGISLLDEATCHLIIKRLRYLPETDARGRPVPQTVDGEHTWYFYDAPPDDTTDDN